MDCASRPPASLPRNPLTTLPRCHSLPVPAAHPRHTPNPKIAEHVNVPLKALE